MSDDIDRTPTHRPRPPTADPVASPSVYPAGSAGVPTSYGLGLSVGAGDGPFAGRPADEIVIGGPRETTLMPALLEPPQRRRRYGLIAAGLAVTLVVGAAVAGAWVWNGWGATLPEQVLPGSAAGFARIDLSPGLGLSLKVTALAGKFPKTKNADKDAIEKTTAGIIDGLGLAPLTYDADIKPWFANRLGVAIWSPPAAGGKVCQLIALASDDDAAAGAALAKVRDKKSVSQFGFGFHKGYAIVAKCVNGGSQAAADAAIAATATESLADHKDYADTLGTLPSGQLAVVWADLDAIATALRAELGAEADGRLPTSIQGQLIVGLAPTSTSIDLRFRLRGGAAPGTNADATAKLAALPGGSVLGVATDLHAPTGPGGLNGLTSFIFGGLPDAASPDSRVIVPEGVVNLDPSTNCDGAKTPADVQACTGLDPECQKLITDQTATPADIRACVSPGSVPTLDPECEKLLADPATTDPDITKCLTERPMESGIHGGFIVVNPSLIDGLAAVLRTPFTAAFSSLGDNPAMLLTALAANNADAAGIAALFDELGSPQKSTTAGTTVTLTSPDFVAGRGTLGDDARYRETMAGTPGNAVVAFYANLERAAPSLTLTAGQDAQLAPIKAVGGAIGYDGNDSVGLIRVLIP